MMTPSWPRSPGFRDEGRPPPHAADDHSRYSRGVMPDMALHDREIRLFQNGRVRVLMRYGAKPIGPAPGTGSPPLKPDPHFDQPEPRSQADAPGPPRDDPTRIPRALILGLTISGLLWLALAAYFLTV